MRAGFRFSMHLSGFFSVVWLSRFSFCLKGFGRGSLDFLCIAAVLVGPWGFTSLSFFLRFVRLGSEEKLYEELWRACAGPLVDVPRQGERVFYFPQGHMEQVKLRNFQVLRSCFCLEFLNGIDFYVVFLYFWAFVVAGGVYKSGIRSADSSF